MGELRERLARHDDTNVPLPEFCCRRNQTAEFAECVEFIDDDPCPVGSFGPFQASIDEHVNPGSDHGADQVELRLFERNPQPTRFGVVLHILPEGERTTGRELPSLDEVVVNGTNVREELLTSFLKHNGGGRAFDNRRQSIRRVDGKNLEQFLIIALRTD